MTPPTLTIDFERSLVCLNAHTLTPEEAWRLGLQLRDAAMQVEHADRERGHVPARYRRKRENPEDIMLFDVVRAEMEDAE